MSEDHRAWHDDGYLPRRIVGQKLATRLLGLRAITVAGRTVIIIRTEGGASVTPSIFSSTARG